MRIVKSTEDRTMTVCLTLKAYLLLTGTGSLKENVI